LGERDKHRHAAYRVDYHKERYGEPDKVFKERGRNRKRIHAL
jgi:hypothetical protein